MRAIAETRVRAGGWIWQQECLDELAAMLDGQAQHCRDLAAHFEADADRLRELAEEQRDRDAFAALAGFRPRLKQGPA